MNNDLINELYSKIDNQEKIIVDLQKTNSGITLEEHVRVLNAYQELQEKYNKQKEVIDKIMNLIKKYGKYDGKKCTRGFQMWSADFNKILDILKEGKNE